MQKMTDGNDSGTKIKICGLRRREDILAVNEAKPDYCGFIIEFPSSFRSVTADEVRELVKELDPEIRPVGVFVNAPMELVRILLDDGTLALAQLHGQEDESYIRELKTYTDKLIIKAFSIKTAEDIEKALQSPADYILLDQGGGGFVCAAENVESINPPAVLNRYQVICDTFGHVISHGRQHGSHRAEHIPAERSYGFSTHRKCLPVEC